MIQNSGEFIYFIVFVFDSQNAYVEYKEIQAAQGVKIAAKELEKAIAGEVIVFRNGTDNALKFQVARVRMFYYCFCLFILWSSGQSFWLQIQRSWVRFLALPDFLSSSGSGTGSTQPREPREVN